MTVVVTIDDDEGKSTDIRIVQLEGTNNYDYAVNWQHGKGGEGSWGGTVYNHEGNYYELVKKVMNGRDLP